MHQSYKRANGMLENFEKAMQNDHPSWMKYWATMAINDLKLRAEFHREMAEQCKVRHPERFTKQGWQYNNNYQFEEAFINRKLGVLNVGSKVAINIDGTEYRI
jgi:hypothetical protein